MKRIITALIGCLAASVLLLNGCAVGPDYHKPSTSSPAHWSEPLAGGETNAPAALTDWWKTFHDSELDLLIERAVRSNLDLRIAQARVLEARAQYGIAAADLWPSASTYASYERQQQSQNQPLLSSFSVPPSAFENNVYQAGFDASWEIDIFGGKRRAAEAANANLSAVELNRRGVLVTLLSEVARNYVLTRGLQAQLAIALQQIKSQEETVSITQSRVDHGHCGDGNRSLLSAAGRGNLS